MALLTKGVITIEPLRKLGDYVAKVRRNGADGTDLETLLPPEGAVPLGRYTGWNLRRRHAGAEAMLVRPAGAYYSGTEETHTSLTRQRRGDLSL
ncbi:MAG TPA: hypothetical protein VKA46_11540 [Gemmataceae bacterium]|nr:hypothetical protein [Gemmataceae bacterium]